MEPPSPPAKLLICDDHRIIIDGLRLLLGGVPWVDVAGTAASGPEAIEFLEHIRVDLVLLDLNMPGMDGAEVLGIIKRRWPATKVIILTMEDGFSVVRRLLDQGADGYLMKTCERADLMAAIQAVQMGKKHFSAELTESLLRPPAAMANSGGPLAVLSAREREVLAALSEGLSNKEIGDRLYISPRTVDTHRTNLMKKLGVHNLAGLVRLAISAGLLK